MCQGTFSRRARSLATIHILVRVRIIGTFRGISYCTKKPGKIIPAIFSKAPQNIPATMPKTPYTPPSADARTLKSLRAASAPEAYTGISPDHKRHHPRADVQCLPYGRGSGAFYPSSKQGREGGCPHGLPRYRKYRDPGQQDLTVETDGPVLRDRG